MDGVTDGGVYNQDVTVNFSNGTAVLNGSLITTGESVSAEGHYTLVVTSISGKTKTIQFTIDKTAPIVTGVTYGSTYLPNIQISFNEGTATLNGYPFTSGSTVSAEGLYTLIVTDSAGNTTTVEFTIRLPIVSYDSNGGTAVPPENVAYNGAATPPSDPTRTGHTFEGWYEDSRLTTVYDFTTPVTADISLYAKWIVNSTGTPTNPDNGGGSPGVNENNGGSPPVKEKESEEENTAEAEEHNESSEPAPDPSISVTDIAGHWAKAAIIKAIELGVVTGYADGTFQPDKRINRAEFMTMLGRALKLPDSQDRLSFSDTNEIPAYARPYISQGVKLGIISGYADGSFAARKELSRSEMTAMIVRAGGIEVMPDAKLSFADAEDIPSWAVPYIAAAVDKGLVEGVGRHRFAPQQTATRAEAVTLVLALLEDR
ncbi:S-layer homology domain-containing protein [Paenibacillus sp. JCM 10914]|uniref:S-layer homology domain-containing protein n=1 Tax=Paenibacillus sp. JCM 10914 TaxID=1236974 RepID=UPI0003CC4527|nr:S-layer homology domain-containing protein [Paenibacillus sp. JCM 10914]GAE06792.1 hypothetical protein JCM10914_2969 [Paenibacillus sp. JCM 10914]